MPDFKLDSVFTPTADQPKAIAALAEGVEEGERFQTLLGATGTGKTMTMAGVIEAGAAPDAGDRPQQDARGAAVQRVPHVLPGQRGRVLRLLLRLLPARGVRPEPGPVHREGLGDQPGGRPPAPRGDRGGVRAPRRDRGRVGVVHLRPGLAGDLRDEHADPQARRDDRPRRAAAQTRLDPVHAQRHGALARHLPRARRDAGGVPGLRRDGLPGDDVRRRGRAPAALRPAHRRADRRRPRARRDLAGDALQRQGGHDRGGRGGDRPRAERALRAARVAKASSSSPTACASARSTTWRCCARSASARGSRTTRGSSTGASPASGRTA